MENAIFSCTYWQLSHVNEAPQTLHKRDRTKMSGLPPDPWLSDRRQLQAGTRGVDSPACGEFTFIACNGAPKDTTGWSIRPNPIGDNTHGDSRCQSTKWRQFSTIRQPEPRSAHLAPLSNGRWKQLSSIRQQKPGSLTLALQVK